jgi:hypothetical protein
LELTTLAVKGYNDHLAQDRLAIKAPEKLMDKQKDDRNMPKTILI